MDQCLRFSTRFVKRENTTRKPEGYSNSLFIQNQTTKVPHANRSKGSLKSNKILAKKSHKVMKMKETTFLV